VTVYRVYTTIVVSEADKCWTPHKVELTLWSYHIINHMDPELFDKLLNTSKTKIDDRSEPKAKKRKI